MLCRWLGAAAIAHRVSPRCEPCGCTTEAKEEFNANKDGCTQNTQIVQGGSHNCSQAAAHAFDPRARIAAIELQASRLQIIDALYPMCVVQCFDGLRFDQDYVLDQ